MGYNDPYSMQKLKVCWLARELQREQFCSKGNKITLRANIPNKEDPLRARSTLEGTSGDTLLINNPYKPIPNINMTVPAR
jgi:hypothetical protein